MPEAVTDSSWKKPSTKTLPDVPEENSLLHVVIEYRKQLRLDLEREQRMQQRSRHQLLVRVLASNLGHERKRKLIGFS